jgi:putative hydrolase of the HAD superfamily
LSEITAIFFDIGGVCLSNGWSEPERRQVVSTLGLDFTAFEKRHAQVIDAFDYGQISLKEYLDWTVFYQPRPFTRQDFFDEIGRITTALPGTLEIAGELRAAHRYLLATLNNEPREINEYRIQHFGLRDYFSAFFSSCYLGVRKPQLAAYQKAMQITQRRPQECLFIDDVAENIDAARSLGMETIHFLDAGQLRQSLQDMDILSPGLFSG